MFLTPLDYVLQVLWYETKNRHLIIIHKHRSMSVWISWSVPQASLKSTYPDRRGFLETSSFRNIIQVSVIQPFIQLYRHSYDITIHMIRIKKPNPFLKLDSLLFSVFDYHNREVGFALANDWEFPYSARNQEHSNCIHF